MASYNNYYGNIVYSILGGRVSELIKDIAMSDKCRSKGICRTMFYYDTNDIIVCCNIMENKAFDLRWLHEIKHLTCL